ncbi:hypothetical protein BLS_003324 [Venturia inaequalis]|uniref:Uncharacterized protein n=1 Tax=Venturia inaequalis TaxID=5025 RepID=A0A8H3UR31_VENIN|nr:hypothetical protein BLS_003324 [Venturia inaequalis]
MAPKKELSIEEKPRRRPSKKADAQTPAVPPSVRTTRSTRAKPGDALPTNLFDLGDPEPRRRSQSPEKKTAKAEREKAARAAKKGNALAEIKEETGSSEPQPSSGSGETSPSKPETAGRTGIGGRGRAIRGRSRGDRIASNPLEPSLELQPPPIMPAPQQRRKPTQPSRAGSESSDDGSISLSSEAVSTKVPEEETRSPADERRFQNAKQEAARRKAEEDAKNKEKRVAQKKKDKEEKNALKRRRKEEAERQAEEERIIEEKRQAEEERVQEKKRISEEERQAEKERIQEENRQEEKKRAESKEREKDEKRSRMMLARQQQREREASQLLVQQQEELSDYEDEEAIYVEQPEVVVDGTSTAGSETAVEQTVPNPRTVVQKITQTEIDGADNSPDSGSSSSSSTPDRERFPKKSLSPAPEPPASLPAHISGSDESTTSHVSGSARPNTNESVASQDSGAASIGVDFNYDDSKDSLMNAEFRSFLNVANPFMADTTNSLGRDDEGEMSVHERLGDLQHTQSAVHNSQRGIQNSVNSLQDNLGARGLGDASIRREVRDLRKEITDIKRNLGEMEDEDNEQHIHQKLNWLNKDMGERHDEVKDKFDSIDETFKKTSKDTLDGFDEIKKTLKKTAKDVEEQYDKVRREMEHDQGAVGDLVTARKNDSDKTTTKLDALERAQCGLQNAQREHRKETQEQFKQLLEAITSTRKRKRGHDRGEHRGRGDSSNSHSSSSGGESGGDGRRGSKRSRKSMTPEDHAPTDSTRTPTRGIGTADSNARDAQEPAALDVGIEHDMPRAPRAHFERPPPPTEKRSFSEVDRSDIDDRNGSPTKKPRTQAPLENGNKDSPETLRRKQTELAHDFGPGKPRATQTILQRLHAAHDASRKEKANRNRAENPSESAPPAGSPPRKRAKFQVRPPILHKLTEEDKEADRNMPAPKSSEKNEYSVRNLLKKLETPVYRPYEQPRPGQYGSLPTPAPPSTRLATSGPSQLSTNPNPVDLQGEEDEIDNAYIDDASETQAPSRQPSNDEEDDGVDNERDFTPSRIPQDPPATPVGPVRPPTTTQLQKEAARVAALQSRQYPPQGPDVNIVYGGHEVADFGDTELGPETPPRLTPSNSRRNGPGEHSPIIPEGNGQGSGYRAPTARMIDPRPSAPTIPTPTNRSGMPPHQPVVNATPQAPTADRPRQGPPAPPTPVVPRTPAPPRTPVAPRTPRPPPPAGIASTENKINNFGGPKLPYVYSPKRKSVVKPKPRTPAPSTLREVKNASTLSSPGTVSPPISPGRPMVPASPSLDSDNLDFNSDELQEDSYAEHPDEDDSEYPPDDSHMDLNQGFEQFADNSRLDANELESEDHVEYYGDPDEASVAENAELYDSEYDDGDQTEVDIDASLPYGADEITLNLGNPRGHFHYPFNPHTEFDDDEEDAQYPEDGEEDLYDEDGYLYPVADQEDLYEGDGNDVEYEGEHAPTTGRTTPRDGTTLESVMTDEESDDGEVEVALEGIDDDSMFNDEAELERARESRLKAEKGVKPRYPLSD